MGYGALRTDVRAGKRHEMSTGKRRPLRLLTINTGSSSLKVAQYEVTERERRTLAIQVERIGHAGSHLTITDADGATLLDERRDLPDHQAALDASLAWLGDHA